MIRFQEFSSLKKLNASFTGHRNMSEEIKLFSWTFIVNYISSYECLPVLFTSFKQYWNNCASPLIKCKRYRILKSISVSASELLFFGITKRKQETTNKSNELRNEYNSEWLFTTWYEFQFLELLYITKSTWLHFIKLGYVENLTWIYFFFCNLKWTGNHVFTHF